MTSTIYPILKRGLKISNQEQSLIIRRANKCYFLDDSSGKMLLTIQRLMNGQHDLSEIAKVFNIKYEDVKELFDELVSVGLAIDRTSIPKKQTGAELVKTFSSVRSEWIRQIYSHGIWEGMRKGELPYNVVLGWIVENFHYLTSAGKRLGLAAAHCPDNRIRSLLARHCVEEYDHCEFFLDSTVYAGLSRDEVKNSYPLPSTLALINQLRFAGISGWLDYVLCSSLLEATSNRDLAQEAFKLLERHYSFSPNVFEPWLIHLDLDKDLEHKDMFELIVAPVESFSLEDISSALQNVRLMVETVGIWFDEIIQYYSNPSVHIPRPSYCI